MSTSEIVVVSCNQGVTVGATMAIVGSSVQLAMECYIFTHTITNNVPSFNVCTYIPTVLVLSLV